MLEGRFKALTRFSFTACIVTAAVTDLDHRPYFNIVDAVGLEGFIFFLAAAMTEGLMQENP
jgi:hypothetical protein